MNKWSNKVLEQRRTGLQTYLQVSTEQRQTVLQTYLQVSASQGLMSCVVIKVLLGSNEKYVDLWLHYSDGITIGNARGSIVDFLSNVIPFLTSFGRFRSRGTLWLHNGTLLYPKPIQIGLTFKRRGFLICETSARRHCYVYLSWSCFRCYFHLKVVYRF